MSSSEVRRRGSGLAAVAVVIGAVLLWWLFSGNGPQGPPGNDPRLLIPDGAATPSPGAGAPAEPEAAPGTARLTAYEVEDARLHLWTRGAEAGGTTTCDTAERPRVLESDVSVIVTVPVDTASCAGADGVWVALSSRLGDRAVLDGSTSPPVRVAPR